MNGISQAPHPTGWALLQIVFSISEKKNLTRDESKQLQDLKDSKQIKEAALNDKKIALEKTLDSVQKTQLAQNSSKRNNKKTLKTGANNVTVKTNAEVNKLIFETITS